eukprot:TRINITY_DN737_c3_g1_i2.p1 TRINITY_DN737_c3_g1~~TRINITY_DN737_c3_g1_i2.p1  ORF type:complete len:389 (+),score=54.92 TRINITY_DN737_c3_g1_i2:71-1168(+)
MQPMSTTLSRRLAESDLSIDSGGEPAQRAGEEGAAEAAGSASPPASAESGSGGLVSRIFRWGRRLRGRSSASGSQSARSAPPAAPRPGPAAAGAAPPASAQQQQRMVCPSCQALLAYTGRGERTPVQCGRCQSVCIPPYPGGSGLPRQLIRCGRCNVALDAPPAARHVRCGGCGHVNSRSLDSSSAQARRQAQARQLIAAVHAMTSGQGPASDAMRDFDQRLLELARRIGQDLGRQRHQVDPAAVARLPRRVLPSGPWPGLGEGCTICLDDWAEGAEVLTLPCFHVFHTGCVETWLERSSLCPMCKHAVDCNSSAGFGEDDVPGDDGTGSTAAAPVGGDGNRSSGSTGDPGPAPAHPPGALRPPA